MAHAFRKEENHFQQTAFQEIRSDAAKEKAEARAFEERRWPAWSVE